MRFHVSLLGVSFVVGYGLGVLGCHPTIETSGSSATETACLHYCGDIPIADLNASCAQVFGGGIVKDCNPDSAPITCKSLPTTHAPLCPDGHISHPYCCAE